MNIYIHTVLGAISQMLPKMDDSSNSLFQMNIDLYTLILGVHLQNVS